MDQLFDEAMAYIRDNDVLIATREERSLGPHTMYVCTFKKRIGDQLYECGGMDTTQRLAIVRSYMKWREYWKTPTGAGGIGRTEMVASDKG